MDDKTYQTILSYIESKRDSWSETSQRSELSRLANLPAAHIPSDPQALYTHMVNKGSSAYSIKTTMVRVSELVDHGISCGTYPAPNLYKQFMRDRARLFKSVYVPKKPTVTFDEALAHINSELAHDDATRAFAVGLLTSGARLSEAQSVTESADSQVVVGKGNKSRLVYNIAPCASGVSVKRLRRVLAKVGLTPHMLRKLAATKAVELGAREADLLAMFGWQSAQTASYYVQATKTGELAQKMKELTHGK